MQAFLMLEPDRDVFELIELILRVAGFTVVADVESAEGVIVDPAYPELFERAVELKRRDPRLRIVCVSIAPPQPHVVEALAPVAYLQKPFGRGELLAALGAGRETGRST